MQYMYVCVGYLGMSYNVVKYGESFVAFKNMFIVNMDP